MTSLLSHRRRHSGIALLHEIPYSLTFLWRVRSPIPSIFAACVLFPSVFSRAATTASRSISSSVRAEGRGIGPDGEGGRMLSSISGVRSEEHTSELQSRLHLGCPLLLLK